MLPSIPNYKIPFESRVYFEYRKSYPGWFYVRDFSDTYKFRVEYRGLITYLELRRQERHAGESEIYNFKYECILPEFTTLDFPRGNSYRIRLTESFSLPDLYQPIVISQSGNKELDEFGIVLLGDINPNKHETYVSVGKSDRHLRF